MKTFTSILLIVATVLCILSLFVSVTLVFFWLAVILIGCFMAIVDAAETNDKYKS